MRALVLLALLATACNVQIASWSAATPPGPTTAAGTLASRGLFEGRSCRWWVLGVPLGLPQIDEALTDALRRGRGTAMRNLTLSSVHPSWGLVGRHCYAVKGEVVG